jgi:cyclopropane fatty-acyl-phospholipid synthase-like methyltransferase
MKKSREAWQKLYSKHGIQYGGTGDIGLLEQILKPGMKVLDAGCGDGKTTEILAKKAEVVGCDFSREALVSLQHQRGLDIQADLVECELGNLPFADEKFNVITCVHSLSHMKESERSRAAKEIIRSLLPGGNVLVEAFDHDDFRYGKGEEIERASFLRGNGIMTHYFERGEVQTLFDGLEIVAETQATRRVSFGVLSGKRSVMRVLLRKPQAVS